MIAKTPTGVDFFDEEYGGTYAGRVMLVTGKSGTGKSILSLQFLSQGLKLNERCLLLSARPAEDVALYASAYGIPVDAAIESNNLIILEYSEYVPGRDREDQLKLPPDSFVQLKQIIEDQAIQRVVLDTVLPWVAVNDQESLAEHVFSFVRVFHRLGTTSLFTLPKPASTAAFKLRKLLEDVVPVSISLAMDDADQQLKWHVNKYLGSQSTPRGVPYETKPKLGIVRKMSAGKTGATPGTGSRASFMSDQAKPESAPRSSAPREEKPSKPSFSDLILQTSENLTAVNDGRAPSVSSGWNSIQPANASH